MKNWYIVQSHSSFENKVAKLKDRHDRDEVLTQRLQVAEFNYSDVGIKYIETDVYDDFRNKSGDFTFLRNQS